MVSFRSFNPKLFVVMVGLGYCLTMDVLAAVRTWTGLGGTGNWSTSGNWDTGAPQNNDSVVFINGTANFLTTNNIAGRTLASITFSGSGGSMFARGNAITLTGGISASHTGGADTCDLDITLATNNQTIAVTGSGVGSALTLSGDINLNGQDLTVNVTDSGNELICSGAISGTGNITKNTGAGGLWFTGSTANTYVGTTTVNTGYIFPDKSSGVISVPGDVVIGNGSATDTLQLGNDNQIASTADISIHTGGVFDLNGQSNTVASVTFIDGGTVQTLSAGELKLGGTVTLNGAVTFATISGNLHLGTTTKTFTVTNASSTLTISAVIKGGNSGSPFFIPAGITKNGFGTLILSGANTYGGPTTVNDGQLTAENTLALGASGAGGLFNNPTTIVNSNAVLLLENAHITNEVLTLNSINPNGALQVDATGDWIGDITLSTNVVIEASSLLQLGGVISGPGGFTKISASILRMVGTDVNTYAGTTIVNDGTLELDRTIFDGSIPGDLVIGDGTGSDVVRNLVLNQIANTSHVTVNSNGLYDLNGFLDGIGSLELTGGSVDMGGSTLVLFTGGVTANSSGTTATISDGNLSLGNVVRTFDIPSGLASPELLVSAVISQGGIIKTGNGNLQLTGANTYAGLTTISNGFIEVNNAAALGSTNAGTVMAGTSLSHLLINGVSVVGEGLTNNSSASDFRSTGAAGWSGNIVLIAQLDILPFGGTFDLSGVISGTGAVTKSQTGTLIYSGGTANTYTGTTTVNQGTLQLNKTVTDGAIQGDLVIGDDVGGANADVVRLVGNPQLAIVSDVTIASSGLLDLNEVSEGIGTLSGSGEVDTGSSGTGKLLINGSGSTTYSGVIIGAGGVTKQFGTGTFTLAGNNTYLGVTAVTEGTLLVNGSQPQSPVTVGTSGTLGGSGTVGNIAASGNVAPGNSPGTLTSSNVVFTSTGDYFVELTGPNAGTDYDQLNVRGTNALANAALHLNPAFTSPVAIGQQFIIINNDGAEAINGTFSGLPNLTSFLVSGYTFTINYAGGTGNDVVLTLTDVPGATVSSAVSSGNGNHAIDPNECNNLDVVITNKTGLIMTSITATLSSSTAGVVITQPYSDYPNIPGHGTGTNLASFQISTLTNFVCGTDINLQLRVDSSLESDLGSFTMNFVQHTGESAVSPSRYDNSTLAAIPDVGSIDSTNTVSGFVGPLTRVVVEMYLTHTFDADLTNISLIAPDGTTVLLSSKNGGSGDDYGANCSPDASRTTFDDAAGTSITNGAAPFVGTFRPQSSLSAFNANGTPNGNWRLHIADGFGGSLGTLRCWSLFLYGTSCGTGAGPCDNCLAPISGTISFTDQIASGRWIGNLIVAGCGAPKVWPGTVVLNLYYDLYAFTNTTGADACVTVELQSPSNLLATAYLNNFDPANVSSNYLGDAGDSTHGGTTAFSSTVPAGARFLVIVTEVSFSVSTQPYTLQLSGLPCPPPVLAINSVTNTTVRIHWPTSAGGYKLEATPSLSPTNWAFVTNEPIVTGNQFSVTNTPPPTNRFYRLNKP